MARRAALGFKSHTGWAAAVAIAGGEVVLKRRIDMAHDFATGAVFHAGQEMPLEKAKALIESSEERFVSIARAAIAAIVAELRGAGCEVAACGIAAGNPKPLPPLESILRSHALVHAAEGELYRRAIGRACAACGIQATRVAAGNAGALAARIATLGRASGRPWAADQKEAALAALIALEK
ncbi:MAG: hypothetical protein LC689_16225 [Myxococcales bacterium]|nr:hypothetical protein [Myxococcales bacterium]